MKAFNEAFLTLWFSDPVLAALDPWEGYCWITLAGRCCQTGSGTLSGSWRDFAALLRFREEDLHKLLPVLRERGVLDYRENQSGTVRLTLRKGAPEEVDRMRDRDRKREERGAVTPYPETAEEVMREAENQFYIMSKFEAEKFLAEYRATGWTRGGSPVADWKALLGIWKISQTADQRRNALQERRGTAAGMNGAGPHAVPGTPEADDLAEVIRNNEQAFRTHVAKPLLEL